MVADSGPADPAVMHDHPGHLHERPDVGPVVTRGGQEPQDQPHRVDRRVGDTHRGLHLGVEVGFEAERLLGRESLDGNVGRGAALDERFEVLEVLLAYGDEQSVVALERAGGDPLQDRVLPDALEPRLAIADGVARAAVEQTVVPPGRARREFTAFDQGDA